MSSKVSITISTRRDPVTGNLWISSFTSPVPLSLRHYVVVILCDVEEQSVSKLWLCNRDQGCQQDVIVLPLSKAATLLPSAPVVDIEQVPVEITFEGTFADLAFAIRSPSQREILRELSELRTTFLEALESLLSDDDGQHAGDAPLMEEYTSIPEVATVAADTPPAAISGSNMPGVTFDAGVANAESSAESLYEIESDSAQAKNNLADYTLEEDPPFDLSEDEEEGEDVEDPDVAFGDANSAEDADDPDMVLCKAIVESVDSGDYQNLLKEISNGNTDVVTILGELGFDYVKPIAESAGVPSVLITKHKGDPMMLLRLVYKQMKKG